MYVDVEACQVSNKNATPCGAVIDTDKGKREGRTADKRKEVEVWSAADDAAEDAADGAADGAAEDAAGRCH